jgi:DNA-directed RNA polymerase subunit RPC12/RpoP
MLTDEQKLAYLQSRGSACPYCKSHKVLTTGSPGFEGDELDIVSAQAACDACGSSWTDCYKLMAVEEIEGGDQFTGREEI